jgi:stress-induced morphogen
MRYVGLEPEDCFALATYKINNALKRQEEERLPYVFLVLSVPELSAPEVARLIPADYVWALAVLSGRRLVEEAIVERLRSDDHRERFRSIFEKMPEGKFRIISARRAYNLLREKLFERVHALTLRGFTRRFRNAEVDMHLSLSRELTPVRTFFELLIRESPQRVAVGLDRGDY